MNKYIHYLIMSAYCCHLHAVAGPSYRVYTQVVSLVSESYHL
jgi:hypothetical protein